MENPKREAAIHQVMDQMAIVQQRSQSFIARIISRESLTQNQIMLLMQLQLTQNLKITDIAERFMITPGAASSMCDKLEELGLVERTRTKEDRRVVYIQLTEQGTKRVHDLFSTIPEEELDKISSTLQRINKLMAGIAAP
ncbi:MarR family transcriptional regulator [Paenibacillus sp. CAA11]|uniref:MarR family winged helix-turn-helix transcriptional regulator n=1 Tax=Paenibacillus sp. CAA11 TaxID=1532905 RepID=UPI000D348FAE|nr:MarR family transcriptional regulator [Paenibacillus sp. CAA11]AWB43815.1 MarR family transcriptional regulator [Paenibacillus sp. CAA11]